MFKDRRDAAEKLATRLLPYKAEHPLVLGIPRGAVPMAKHIAEALHCDFDVVLVRKLGAPGNPEYAIGAVAENGWTYVSPGAGYTGADTAYIEQEKREQLAVITARRAQCDSVRNAIPLTGRVVVVVDDGLATGATMIAALHALRASHVKKLICAVPVAPHDTLERVRPLCDELICLHTPADFQAVGQFYATFGQVSDVEVLASLRGD